jgi:hypothetical protein
VVLTLAVRAVRLTPALTWVAILLGVPVVVLTVLEAVSPDNHAVVATSGLVHAAFYGYTAWALIRYMFQDDVVTTDELWATGATFTVVAWAFAYLYVAVQVFWPGSFIAAVDSGAPRTWMDLLFLSVTTLTSTGLSDIVPVTPHARSFVMVEQIAGMLYLAMVVAVFYEVTGPRLLRRQRRRHRRLPRADREARLPAVARRRLHLAAAVLPVAAARRRLRHRRLLRVHPDYGTVDDFREFVDEAHQRGIRVIADLVMNHTATSTRGSRSRADPTNPYGDWYVWSDTTSAGTRTRGSSSSTPSRRTGRGTRCASSTTGTASSATSPTSTTTTPRCRRRCSTSLRFWLDLGLDGFRLDAVPYLYERDGTNGENLPRRTST